MKIKRILLSAGIYGSKNLRALIIVAALAQFLFGQAIRFSLAATSSDFSISISPAEVVIPPGVLPTIRLRAQHRPPPLA